VFQAKKQQEALQQCPFNRLVCYCIFSTVIAHESNYWNVGLLMLVSRDHTNAMRFLALIAENLMMTTLWDIARSSLVEDRRFRESYPLRHQGAIPQKTGIFTYMLSHHHDHLTFRKVDHCWPVPVFHSFKSLSSGLSWFSMPPGAYFFNKIWCRS
jgi:hypothetical protein